MQYCMYARLSCMPQNFSSRDGKKRGQICKKISSTLAEIFELLFRFLWELCNDCATLVILRTPCRQAESVHGARFTRSCIRSCKTNTSFSNAYQLNWLWKNFPAFLKCCELLFMQYKNNRCTKRDVWEAISAAKNFAARI